MVDRSLASRIRVLHVVCAGVEPTRLLSPLPLLLLVVPLSPLRILAGFTTMLLSANVVSQLVSPKQLVSRTPHTSGVAANPYAPHLNPLETRLSRFFTVRLLSHGVDDVSGGQWVDGLQYN